MQKELIFSIRYRPNITGRPYIHLYTLSAEKKLATKGSRNYNIY